MFSFLFSKKTIRKSSPISNKRGYRPQLETLEDRLVMTTHAGIGIGGCIVLDGPPILSKVILTMPTEKIDAMQPAAKPVDLTTIPRQVLADLLTGASDSDLFSVQLQQGDFLEAEVQTASTLKLSSLMTIMNASGMVLATIGASANPTTGIMSTNPAYGFVAPETGTYQIKIAGATPQLGTTRSAAPTLATSGAYSLELHRLALAQGIQSFETLAQKGSMYAFLKNGQLDIVGPTGYGFGLKGNWTQTVTQATNGRFASTYTATSGVTLETAAGPVTLNVAAGNSFIVTTRANTFGANVGEISGMAFKTSVSTGALLSPFMAGSAFGFDLSKLDMSVTITGNLGGIAGIGLGSSTKVKGTGAPVNNAIPYMYFTLKPLGTGMTNVVSVVCDPADPALFIESGVKGLKLGPVEVNGIGMSRHGLIPFTPINTPTQYSGNIGGNLTLQGSFDTTSITLVPSKVVGDVTFNLDPNRTGQLFGGQGATAAGLAGIFAQVGTGGGAAFLDTLNAGASTLGNGIGQLFRNFSVGINGTLKINLLGELQKDLSWEVGNQILMMPTKPDGFIDGVLNYANENTIGNTNLLMLSVGKASLIYDGPTASFYFRGSTVNPFKGTPLASFASPYAVDLDVAVQSGGKFFMDMKGSYKYMGLAVTGEILIAHNYPVVGPAAQILGSSSASALNVATLSRSTSPVLYSGVYIAANVRMLSLNIGLTGQMFANGDFIIKGSAEADLGSLERSATVTMSKTQAQGFQFTGTTSDSFRSTYIRGHIDTTLKFGISGGRVTYAGSAEAEGEVKVPVYGWVGGSLSAGVDNTSLWVKVGGHKKKFAW